MNDLLYNFLLQVDKEFPTSLSSRVNLKDYAKKLLHNAFISVSIQDNKIVGCVAMYCNEYETMSAYIPLVAVDKNYRGQHISKALMACAIKMAQEKGFKKIGLHTENDIALNLYNSLGFKIMNSESRKYLELTL